MYCFQPNDLTRQSLPFSYLALSVASKDGAARSVQVYTDISAEWASGDNSLTVNWSTDTITNGLTTHQVQLQTQQRYTESNDHIQRKLIAQCVYIRNHIEYRGICLLCSPKCESVHWVCKYDLIPSV
jgi:hypothetical protein